MRSRSHKSNYPKWISCITFINRYLQQILPQVWGSSWERELGRGNKHEKCKQYKKLVSRESNHEEKNTTGFLRALPFS